MYLVGIIKNHAKEKIIQYPEQCMIQPSLFKQAIGRVFQQMADRQVIYYLEKC